MRASSPLNTLRTLATALRSSHFASWGLPQVGVVSKNSDFEHETTEFLAVVDKEQVARVVRYVVRKALADAHVPRGAELLVQRLLTRLRRLLRGRSGGWEGAERGERSQTRTRNRDDQ